MAKSQLDVLKDEFQSECKVINLKYVYEGYTGEEQWAVITELSEKELFLGLGKTDSYWLVKKNYFEIRLIAGKMRVMVDSFEKWYTGQFHYKKVNGELPGVR